MPTPLVVSAIPGALGALACLAAALTVGALVAATLLTGPPARAAAVRLAGVAAASWSAAALATVVASAPRNGAALSDPAGGAAVVAWALGGGAPLALSALGAAALATAVLVRPGGRSDVVQPGAPRSSAPWSGLGALAVAVVAAAPLGALPAMLSTALSVALPGAARGAGPLVLPGSRQAAVVVAGWLALVGAGAWLGGGTVVALVSRRARRSAAVAHRVRTLGRWAAPAVLVLAALALTGALVPPAVPSAATATEAGVLALTGALPPPLPLTAARALLEVAPDPLWLVLALGGALAYLRAVRGLGWPRARTAAWCAGCLVVVWTTSGGPAAYAPLLLSAQMVVHAVLVVVAAPLLVAGAPVSLLERAAALREDGTSAVREVVAAVVSLRSVAVLRRPVAALAVLLVVLAATWATPLLTSAQSTLAGHESATAAVLGAALLAAGSTAAAPRRTAAAAVPAGLALAVAGAGAWTATTARLLAAGWSSRLGLGVDALADQHAGAVLAAATVVAGCLVQVLARGVLLLPVTARARTAPGRSAGA